MKNWKLVNINFNIVNEKTDIFTISDLVRKPQIQSDQTYLQPKRELTEDRKEYKKYSKPREFLREMPTDYL